MWHMEGCSPTHYYVMHNEIGFKADGLQMLTKSNCVSYLGEM
jgi:hypothetical protein